MKYVLLSIVFCLFVSACELQNEREDSDFTYTLSEVDWHPFTQEEQDKAENNDTYALEMLDQWDNRTFNQISVKHRNLVIRHTFIKPSPCTDMNYSVQKTHNVIKIIPQIVPPGGEILGGCVLTIVPKYIEITTQLKEGTYRLEIYPIQGDEGFVNKTIRIVD